ncbi:AAA family ATPase [Microbacterium paraoxydans]|uniref:Nuclease SbcCD subunit C n=1 Tax=Microbacterium paraoxydans TaxID=199592 RepID=A0ABS5ILE2_9MICO|nr:SMC family ATPase [Microbacterium paraoxydans]MBS0023132.1 SMC family ATPase [Microbacterium paraoxydans]
MRLHRLEVEGFGPFRARQIVDFDAFADDGIFLIAGRTGAGKSSILDAVCFGLYGGVPRYAGGEKRLRSDHCEPDDPSEVVVEFSTPSGRYRVTRSPEYLRPARRGGGMTKQAAAVALEEHTGSGWIGRAARAVDVAHELDAILQLSREQFLQVILLAQNRFSEFLLAGSRDRQALLRRLFGTERFEDVQSRFDERRRQAEQALGSRLATVSARLDEAERLVAEAGLGGDAPETEETEPGARTTGDRLAELERALARAEYRAERRASERVDAEKRSTEADTALAARRDEQRAQAERDRARAALARLDAEEPGIAEARAELANARAAEALRSTIAAAARARVALEESLGKEADAAAAWAAHDLDVDDLDAWVAERLREVGGWERAAALERQAAERAVEQQAAEVEASSAQHRVETAEAERDALPALVAAVEAERATARDLAARQPGLENALRAAKERCGAAGEVERLEAACATAEAELARATTEHAAAQSQLAWLRQRRMDGMAGELASSLVDGEPCAVCGSRSHPAPASHTDPVSADDIADAESVRDAAAAAERKASDACAALRAERAAAAAKADGRDPVRAERELRAAEEEHAAAVEATTRAAELDAQLADLTARREQQEAEVATAVAALAAARERLALIVQRNRDADAQVANARGDFASVAERIATVADRTEVARRLSEARAERVRREEATTEAERERDAALVASVFSDTAEAEEALRPTAEQEALDARIARHAVQREKERAILFDLELRTLPEEPIDTEAAERASSEARATWSAAVDAATLAAGDATRLSGLLAAAAEEQARTAEDAEAFEVLQNLADTIAGRGANTRKMTLETFVLAAELEEIVEAANRRLHDMSEGRYRLQHSDALAARGAASGLGIVVADAFTGQTRPPQSLSGGETFLTSLALALGLAEVVTARAGGIRLDTLFIDEGFGSLDGDTLDIAMRTLDELRQGGRTVGVISHVEAMQEQIPAQLTVRALANGPSVIEAR